MKISDFDPEFIEYIKSHYDEPHRVYHNWDHIISCFEKIPLFADAYTDSPHIKWILRDVAVCILYHDIVYIPGALDNETQSADLVATWSGRPAEMLAGWSIFDKAHNIQPLKYAIYETREHRPTQYSTLVSQILCDIDLADMGYTDGRYIENSFKIKEEFKATDEQWLVGRVKFLEDFMGRKRIFQTPLGVELWEKNARNNMLLEYNALKMKYGEV